MSNTNELSQLVKRRRDVQDLDLEWYVRVKSDILGMIIDLKNNKIDEIDLEKIDKLKIDIKTGKIKAELGLDFELAKHNICLDEVENYDKKIRTTLTDYIIKSAKEFKDLSSKIDYAKEILINREKLNRTIQDYFTKTKVIKLSQNELNLLFDTDTNDLNSILSSGKLIHEDKSNSLNSEYEFTFSKNSSFTLSTKDLDYKINEQIQECNEVENHIKQSKETWKNATTKLISLLETIEKEVQL
jgi:hypothetical protein